MTRSTSNPFTQLTLPTTLSDLIVAREKAVSLHRQARKLNEAAEDLLGQVGKYRCRSVRSSGIPICAQFESWTAICGDARST